MFPRDVSRAARDAGIAAREIIAECKHQRVIVGRAAAAIFHPGQRNIKIAGGAMGFSGDVEALQAS